MAKATVADVSSAVTTLAARVDALEAALGEQTARADIAEARLDAAAAYIQRLMKALKAMPLQPRQEPLTPPPAHTGERISKEAWDAALADLRAETGVAYHPREMVLRRAKTLAEEPGPTQGDEVDPGTLDL